MYFFSFFFNQIFLGLFHNDGGAVADCVEKTVLPICTFRTFVISDEKSEFLICIRLFSVLQTVLLAVLNLNSFSKKKKIFSVIFSLISLISTEWLLHKLILRNVVLILNKTLNSQYNWEFIVFLKLTTTYKCNKSFLTSNYIYIFYVRRFY